MSVLRVMLVAGVVSNVSAQSSIAGFWNLVSRHCTPTSPRCGVTSSGAWTDNVAIEVQREFVLVTTARRSANPWAPAPVDTFRVDGKIVQWLAGRRGVARSWSSPGNESYSATGSRRLWPGESWTVSRDGTTLVHEYRWKFPGDSTRWQTSIWTYRRSAG